MSSLGRIDQLLEGTDFLQRIAQQEEQAIPEWSAAHAGEVNALTTADIAAFTIVQEATDFVRIEIVPGAGYVPRMSRAIEARFRSLVAEPLRVEVETTAALRRSAAGKHHPIVSRVRASVT